MYQPLAPCPGCRRHVRADGASCPFCGAAVEGARPVPSAAGRLARGAVFAFASSVIAVGCSSEDAKPVAADTGTVTDTGGAAPAYGAPADDTGTSDTGMTDDTGGPIAAYGAPPDVGVDASAADASDDGTVDDTGGSGAKYGAPPPP